MSRMEVLGTLLWLSLNISFSTPLFLCDFSRLNINAKPDTIFALKAWNRNAMNWNTENSEPVRAMQSITVYTEGKLSLLTLPAPLESEKRLTGPGSNDNPTLAETSLNPNPITYCSLTNRINYSKYIAIKE
ncbi:hypothetical protein V6N13_120341 [Hibiscus sabdariffa]|uniref:Uncharacterized protein n=1 Tax=Hibiscus sabdariffa TaxID=183260 RepID=A0ABR2E413_9ROSI